MSLFYVIRVLGVGDQNFIANALCKNDFLVINDERSNFWHHSAWLSYRYMYGTVP